jgi:hypothetical protein
MQARRTGQMYLTVVFWGVEYIGLGYLQLYDSYREQRYELNLSANCYMKCELLYEL